MKKLLLILFIILATSGLAWGDNVIGSGGGLTGAYTTNDCVKVNATGQLVSAGGACGTSSMVYPSGTGLARATGGAWDTIVACTTNYPVLGSGQCGSAAIGSAAYTASTAYAPSSGIALSALATQATHTILGNSTGSTAVPTAMSVSDTQTLLGLGASAYHADNYFSLLAGSSSITTLGTIGTGVWHGTAIDDTYISSASTWNAKQATTGTPAGFVIASQATGDLLYASSASAWSRLGVGTDSYVLTVSPSTHVPVWAAASGGGYTNLTSFTGQTAWRLFYSNTSGVVTELALGANGTYLMSNGASAAPTFGTPSGAGDFKADASVALTGAIKPSTFGGQNIGTTSYPFGDHYYFGGSGGSFYLDLNGTAATSNKSIILPNLAGHLLVTTDTSVTAVSTTVAKLNYLTNAGGTTGTDTTNLVFSTSPALTTPTVATSIAPPSFGTATLGTTALPFSHLYMGASGGTYYFDITGTPGTSSKTLTIPNETGTFCTTGSVCSGYQASGSYLTSASTLDATKLSGNLPAISGASLTSLPTQVSNTAYNSTTWQTETTIAPSANAVSVYLESKMPAGTDGTYGADTTRNTTYFACVSGYDCFGSMGGKPVFNTNGTANTAFNTLVLGPAATQISFSGTLTNGKACTFATGGAITCNTTLSGTGDFMADATVPLTGAIHPSAFGSQNLGTTSYPFGAHVYLGGSGGTYYIDLTGTAASTNKTVTIPNETGTICTTGSVCSGYQGTTGTPAGFVIASQATGDLLYASSASAWTRLGIGTDNYVLTISGSTHLPVWAASAGGAPALDAVTDPSGAKTFTLYDNNASALSFGSTGAADILKIITTNSAEGVSLSKTLSVTGNTTINVTGSTQCLHVNTSGVISGTGADCGSAGGGTILGSLAASANYIPSSTGTSNTIQLSLDTIDPTTGAITTPQQTTPDYYYFRPGSGATNPTYYRGFLGPAQPVTGFTAYQLPNADPTAGQVMSFGAVSSNVSAITWITPAIVNQTMYIGSTAVAINRGTASLALTGITSIDGSAATLASGGTGVTAAKDTDSTVIATTEYVDNQFVIIGSGMTAGRAYYLAATTGTLTEADATSITTLPTPAICVATSATVCRRIGKWVTTGLTAGAMYYVPVGGGAVSVSKPVASGNQQQAIGQASSATVLEVWANRTVIGF